MKKSDVKVPWYAAIPVGIMALLGPMILGEFIGRPLVLRAACFVLLVAAVIWLLQSSKVRPLVVKGARPVAFCLTFATALLLILGGGFWIFYGNKSVDPKVTILWRMMPFDPPYPEGTEVAGIRFDRNALDARMSFKVEHARIKNVDLNVSLINTSGQMLGIRKVAQRTAYHGIDIVPVETVPASPDSVTVIGSNTVTIPFGGASPQGSLDASSYDAWRIMCPELRKNTMPVFVLMVTRPYRTNTPMIEGFKVTGSYDFDGDKRTGQIDEIVVFDEKGNPGLPTPEQLERIKKYKKPEFKISNFTIDVTGTGTYPMLPPGWGTNSRSTKSVAPANPNQTTQ